MEAEFCKHPTLRTAQLTLNYPISVDETHTHKSQGSFILFPRVLSHRWEVHEGGAGWCGGQVGRLLSQEVLLLSLNIHGLPGVDVIEKDA